MKASEECFEQQDDGCYFITPASSTNSINTVKNVINYLPKPNQLHQLFKPQQMIPRVFARDNFEHHLPHQLNAACQQIQNFTVKQGNRPKLGTKQKITLNEYIQVKDLQQIYQKQGKQMNKNEPVVTMRLRNICSQSDFNSKMYKQLKQGMNRSQNRKRDRIDSNYECGNLSKAFMSRNDSTYYLVLDQDVNTHGYTNWFFFRFRNCGTGLRRFFLLNMGKKCKFYKQNMKISIFSMQKCKDQQLHWFKGGQNIHFMQTKLIKNEEDSSLYYGLYFQYDFTTEDDQVYFSLCQPYSYSRCIQFVNHIKAQYPTQVNIDTIGHSICQNIIPSITISKDEEEKKKRKKIVVLGRQHPSEMAGSFISQYLIKELLNPTHFCSSYLLDKYEWVFIPMVNPDGVIYGNSRCNIAGYDLNRQWGQNLIKQFTPETFRIKSYLNDHKNSIKFVLDLHGHGKKLNSFMFCCKNEDRFSHRIFPFIMSKFQKRFHLPSCTYGITRDKENTLRAQLFQMGIKDCFTFQNSYYGYIQDKKTEKKEEKVTSKSKQKQKSISKIQKSLSQKVIGYQEDDYKEIAEGIIKSLGVYFAFSTEDKQSMLNETGFNYDTACDELKKIADRLEREEKLLFNKHDFQSDSDPEGDILKLKERLKICEFRNNHLNQKICQVYKKTISTRKIVAKGESTKNIVKEQFSESSVQKSVESEKKLETKLIGNPNKNKKKQIKNKFEGRKTSLLIKKESLRSQKIQDTSVKVSFQVNLMKVPRKNFDPSYHHSISSFSKEIKKFGRTRIYSKIKTEINETCNFSSSEIEEQKQRKDITRNSFDKLKDQSLKSMVDNSILLSGTSRNKKCIWVQSLSKKNKIQSQVNMTQSEFSSNTKEEEQVKSKRKKNERKYSINSINKNVLTNEVVLIPKPRSGLSKEKNQKNYKRFKNFVKEKERRKNMLETGNSVFYHFPIM